MAAEQGKDTWTGRVPGLNVERVYTTTVPAEELAQALAGAPSASPTAAHSTSAW